MLNKRGSTLVEMILYVAIVSSVLIATTQYVVTLTRNRAKSEVLAEVAYNAAIIQAKLSYAARHAASITVGSSTFDVDPGVLRFAMVDSGEDPTVFSLTEDDGSLQIGINGVTTQLTTGRVRVTNLVFTNLTSADDAGIVLVEYTLEAINSSNSPFFDYVEEFQTAIRIPLEV
ncbi:MAG: hypothetical protein O3B64_00310 [bacterium]|nr:hypothetical protein [bacterium]MDA1024402.1 hypothetical protein [bacterium]